MRIGLLAEDLAADARLASRLLAKHWGSLALAISTLAVGMALVTTIFAIFDAALVKSPYPGADRLRAISEIYERSSRGFSVVSATTVESMRYRARSFARVGASRNGRGVLLVGNDAHPITTTEVDTSLFAMLGISPRRGRVPSTLEIVSDAPVIVLSDRLASRVAPNGNAIGRELLLGARKLTVIGVMPPGFNFPERTDAWLPLREGSAREPGSSVDDMSLLAELRVGVTAANASLELKSIQEQLRRDDPRYYRNIHLVLRGEAIDRRTVTWKPILLLFLALGGCVMAIGSLNVGNLLLMRAAERRAEFALRRVLGASISRLARQLAVESAIVSGLAAVAAVLLTIWSLHSIDRVVPLGNMPGWFELAPDASVFAVLILVMVGTIAFTSATVVRQVGRLDLGSQLTGASQTTTSANVARVGERAVVVQVILCTAVVVAAFVFVGAYAQIKGASLGYRREGLIVAQLDVDPSRYPDSAALVSADRLLSRRLAENPAIESEAREAGFAGFQDLGRWAFPDVQVYRTEDAENAVTASLKPLFKVSAISDAYFSTRETPLLAGRSFLPSDTIGSPKVAIISRRLAATLYGAESSLGRQFRLGRGGPLITIVGVAADTRNPGTATLGLRETGIPLLYLTDRQAAGGSPIHWIRARTSVSTAFTTVTNELRRMASGLSSFYVREAPEPEGIVVVRVILGVLALTGGIGLLMAVLGIYAITEYAVIQRTRRIGIELALGASPTQVYFQTIKRSFRLIAAGLAVGLALGAIIEVGINPEFWGARAFSPVLYGGVVFLFLAAGLVASHRAARRGANVAPAAALRA